MMMPLRKAALSVATKGLLFAALAMGLANAIQFDTGFSRQLRQGHRPT